MTGILEGLRVVDLSSTVPGPYCTMLLADHGADVIKVERPPTGDTGRQAGVVVHGEGSTFLMLNRNKRSVTLDLKHPGGREVFERLLATADVLLETFRPGTMARLGFDYPRLAAMNARLVYCSLSGFGQDSPYRDRPGHDINYLGYAGALDLIGPAGGPPVLPGIQVADIAAGLTAGMAIVLALLARERTGRGRYLDLAIFDTALAFLTVQAGMHFASGDVPTRGVSELAGGWPSYTVYETKDGRYLSVGAWEEKFWINLCQAVNRPDLIPHHRAEGPTRDWVGAELAATLRTRTLDEWMSVFATADVCAGPVLNVREALADAHVAHRGLRFSLKHPTAGTIEQLANPVRVSGEYPRLSSPPPALGQDNRQVLRGLGYDEPSIEGLARAGVI